LYLNVLSVAIIVNNVIKIKNMESKMDVSLSGSGYIPGLYREEDSSYEDYKTQSDEDFGDLEQMLTKLSAIEINAPSNSAACDEAATKLEHTEEAPMPPEHMTIRQRFKCPNGLENLLKNTHQVEQFLSKKVEQLLRESSI
jgi:hypothetical protein